MIFHIRGASTKMDNPMDRMAASRMEKRIFLGVIEVFEKCL